MTLHYRRSDPSDLRDLGELHQEWLTAGNPKADEWEEAPPQPSPDAVWVEGVWSVPLPPPPRQDWNRLKLTLLGGDEGSAVADRFTAWLVQAQQTAPLAFLGLPDAAAMAERGNYQQLRIVWGCLRSAQPMPDRLRDDLVWLAIACDLPEQVVSIFRGDEPANG